VNGIQSHIESQKTAFQRLIEGFCLILCLCVLVLRATFTESPNMPVTNPFQPLSNDAVSLIISSGLILAGFLWFVFVFIGKNSKYRFSGIEIGLFIFLIAGVVSIFAASNKRAAITDLVTIASPMLMAVVFVQLLDSTSRIKLVLLVALSLGVISTHQCADQFLSSNNMMIRNYMNNPDPQLIVLGIKEGSLEQFLYEHRLFSKDVRGFLTTSNSTGSFLLLSGFVGIGMLLEKFRHSFRTATASMICFVFFAVVVVVGLIFTRSKGALFAGAAALLLLIIFLNFRELIYRYRKPIIILILLVAAVFAFVVVNYGNSHGRLPGGNSMLVRWQYWVASAKMYFEKPFTGVGGGNFKTFYTYYKDPGAIETVKDPHNFVFSLLTQYGLFGFIGFLAAAIIPIFRGFFQKQVCVSKLSEPANRSVLLQSMALLAITITFLIIRPIVKFDQLGSEAQEIVSVILILYIMPTSIFIFAFCSTLLTIKHYPYQQGFSVFVKPAILCGLIAVLIANLIDFAIFEPGVSTLFWMLAAVAVAIDYNNGSRQPVSLSGRVAVRYLVTAGVVAIVIIYINYALVPSVSASVKVRRATFSNIETASKLLDSAIATDRLDPTLPSLKGKMLLRYYDSLKTKEALWLDKAVESFELAISCDNADHKNFANLGRAYELLAENYPDDKKQQILKKAFEVMEDAVDRYPGSAKLQTDLGKIFEKRGAVAEALGCYKKAIDIEDAYRRQFKIMYPDQRAVSRLNKQDYELALERIKVLEKQLP
jgi:O-antigen ligase/polysaccharide polymerase Wzy-like membrane protein